MSNTKKKIDDLIDRLSQERSPQRSHSVMSNQSISLGSGGLPGRPSLPLDLSSNNSPIMTRPQNLTFTTLRNGNAEETDRKLKEIMKISGNLKIQEQLYKTDIRDMEDIEELGNGTCGHVVKMTHKPSRNVIAVKQMRRSGNTEENKRIIMDIEIVLKSHDCKYIVQCLGCFITESEVWICMELMDTCFDKLLKRFKQPVPENVLGKVTVATVEALSYLKDKHGVIHRDVKPSNILLDTKGNVKLCDFGISGRLVDSMAKTRQAGCAAYMAPERIEPDPNNPDYDVRADVWSLGITLVELATGVFPYQDCKTDFEMLTKVIDQDPPSLPQDKDFSPEFRDFVKRCLIKDKKQRPKYTQLKNHVFIKKYETADVNVGEWFVRATQQADAVANRGAPRSNLSINPIRHFFTSHQTQPPGPINLTQKPTNGSPQFPKTSPPLLPPPPPPIGSLVAEPFQHLDDHLGHSSRLSAFQSSNLKNQRDGSSLPYPPHQRTSEYRFSQSTNLPNRSYSPFHAYQNHLVSLQKKNIESHAPQCSRADEIFHSPVLQRRLTGDQAESAGDWRSPCASPLPLRTSQFQSVEAQFIHGSTSPIILQRFHHQQKQQRLAKEAEETGKTPPGKKRFASYIKLQLGGDRSGRSSRHQSPEPPPRLNRTISGDSQSPLVLRKNFLETHAPNSPSLSRRYVSPTPPIPPPRRLTESNSVPGSPQHLRARFHYTPEPQRRIFQNDIS